MKKYWREITIGVLLIVILCLVKCSPEEKTDTKVTYEDKEIVIPEKSGGFEKPNSQTELPSAGKDSVKIGTKYIHTVNPIDAKLKKQIAEAKDSLEILNILVKANQIRENVSDFSNDTLQLSIYTKTAGELQEIKPKWKILKEVVKYQEKTTTITNTVIKKDPSGFIIGGGYNYSLDAKIKSSFEGNAGVRLGKVTILGGVNTNLQVSGKLLTEL